MKPVGQETVTFEEKSIDKDTYLMGEVYHCKKHIKDMSPITVGRGYTEKYILEPQKQLEICKRRFLNLFKPSRRGKDAIIVEGTGHAGVGSVIDCSNADVAHLLGSQGDHYFSAVALVVPLMRSCLIKPCLTNAMSQYWVLSLIRSLPDKLEKIRSIVGKGLERKGIQTFRCHS